MHEISCPSCNAPSQYDLQEYLLMCPFCSVTFSMDKASGKKEIFQDHFIIPNALDSRQVKELVTRWLQRLHHNPSAVEKEFFVVDIHGFSIPYWVVSMEVHTAWQGLVRRQTRQFDQGTSLYVSEKGSFRRNYRWAVSARKNICETWGMPQLHEPKENVPVDWDGFPLDSTYSRGRIDPQLGAKKRGKDQKEDDVSAYDIREIFEFKFANGLPILPIQLGEEEALRRSKNHVNRYHYGLAKLHVDVLVDTRTELEIAGIQLIHIPFWHVRYVYRPKNILKHIQKSGPKNLIMEGYSGGVLKSELSMIHTDKLWVNVLVAGFLAFCLGLGGLLIHPSLLLFSLFMLVISGMSAFTALKRHTSAKLESSFFYDPEKNNQEA